jgi:hypothetical protein
LQGHSASDNDEPVVEVGQGVQVGAVVEAGLGVDVE